MIEAAFLCLQANATAIFAVAEVSSTVPRIMHFRSVTTLCLFGATALVALKYPLAALGICICCLIVYLKPDPVGVRKRISQQ